MRIKSQKDFFSGLLFMAFGLSFALGAFDYKIGESARMGPGYFPLVLGLVLAVLGAAIAFKALTIESVAGDKVGSWAWRPLGCIIAANLLFGVLLGGLPSVGLPAMGMVVAIYGLTLVASLADDAFRLGPVLVLATVLAAMSYVAFVVLLKLQFAVWPAFITG